jgi:diguanylate cyclase (GGDEF)-like protein/PAS domain S-box-containing protein
MQERYAAIVGSAMDAIIAADSRQQITVFNAAAEKMFLCSAAEAIGKPISILIPPRFHDVHTAHMQDFSKAHTTTRAMGNLKPLSAIRANGDEFPIEASISYLHSGGEELFTVIVRDITDRIRAEENAQRLATELQTTNQTLREQMKQLHAAEAALLVVHQELRLRSEEMERSTLIEKHLTEMGEFLQSCVSSAEARQVAEHSLRILFPDSGGIVYLNREFDGILETFANWNSQSLTSKETFEPYECWGLRRGRAHLIYCGDSTTRCAHLQDGKGRSSICVPMMAQGQPLGLFHMIWTDSGATPGPSSREYLEGIAVSAAETLALAIANVKLREKLKEQTIRDPLTNLYNRRYLEDALYREIARARRTGTSVGVIMIDIDNFKQFNDSFGHPRGDQLLHSFGEYLKGQVRSEDVPARYGGEEFCLILPGAVREIVFARAATLREGTRRATWDAGGMERRDGGVSISCGVAVFPENGGTAQVVLQATDQALYEAKRSGKDRVMVSSNRAAVAVQGQ